LISASPTPNPNPNKTNKPKYIHQLQQNLNKIKITPYFNIPSLVCPVDSIAKVNLFTMHPQLLSSKRVKPNLLDMKTFNKKHRVVKYPILDGPFLRERKNQVISSFLSF